MIFDFEKCNVFAQDVGEFDILDEKVQHGSHKSPICSLGHNIIYWRNNYNEELGSLSLVVNWFFTATR